MAHVRFWNVWWTLTLISAAFTIVVVVLEALGFFRDVGIVLGVVGLISTILVGLTASTHSSLVEFRGDVLPRLDGIDSRLGGIDARLGGLEARLDRIITILDERLPRPAL